MWNLLSLEDGSGATLEAGARRSSEAHSSRTVIGLLGAYLGWDWCEAGRRL
ncbi:hypothetical protein I79_006869 [Cricetulus griseus]|uniref:Uncharacterized protein n=1 Tax=Cricetulus griseus TaxID=10029 RepID=G3H908_CRIGR|nr:hypothetical protein I79_006869 [Cricetulus griseus]